VLSVTVQHFLMFGEESFGDWQYQNLNDFQLRKITINVFLFLFAMLYYGHLLHICFQSMLFFFKLCVIEIEQ
jgi:hypothetical protein